MPEYEGLGLEINPDVLQQDGRDWLLDNAPDGYTIDPLVDWVLSAVARMGSEVAVLASQVPDEIFVTFGEEILGIPRLTATPATTTVTFTLADALGHTIPTDSQVDIGDQGFRTLADLVVAAGASTGTVAVEAIVAGSDANDAQDPALLVSPTLTYVNTVTANAPAAGGTDEETPEDYRDRLADELPTLSTKAILIEDFEAIARADAEVHRALAIDNYNPGPPVDAASEGSVTVALMNEAGQPVSALAKSRVQQALAAGRVLNLNVFTIDPTYTTVYVAYTVTKYADADAAATTAAITDALSTFLNPANWGMPSDGAASTRWINETTVRRNDLIGAIYTVPGVRHVDDLRLGTAPAPTGTADITMTGVAAAPTVGAVTGTVT